MNYQKLINENIKKLRLEHQMTQEEFAEKVGISMQGLSNIERNKYQPTADTIDKICEAFAISPTKLLLIDTNNNYELIENIKSLLLQCSSKKLKQIYDIVKILVK